MYPLTKTGYFIIIIIIIIVVITYICTNMYLSENKCIILCHFKPQSHLIVMNGHSNGHFIPNIVLMMIKIQF